MAGAEARRPCEAVLRCVATRASRIGAQNSLSAPTACACGQDWGGAALTKMSPRCTAPPGCFRSARSNPGPWRRAVIAAHSPANREGGTARTHTKVNDLRDPSPAGSVPLSLFDDRSLHAARDRRAQHAARMRLTTQQSEQPRGDPEAVRDRATEIVMAQVPARAPRALSRST